MTLLRYAALVLAIDALGFAGLVAMFWEPERWAPGWPLRFLLGAVLVSAIPIALAARVPPVKRAALTSYGVSNLVLALIWGLALLVAVVGLRATGAVA